MIYPAGRGHRPTDPGVRHQVSTMTDFLRPYRLSRTRVNSPFWLETVLGPPPGVPGEKPSRVPEFWDPEKASASVAILLAQKAEPART